MKTVRLNNDVIMPMVGYGTYQIPAAKTRDNVLQALRTGYRLIDTAQYYGNEDGIGAALQESGLPRDQVFVTTKVQTSGYLETYRAPEEAYQDGKVRPIGLSNFNVAQVQQIIDNSNVVPMVDQIETHLRWQQKRMHAFLASRGIVHESYAPLGKDQPGFMDAPELIQIADKYHRTLGCAALPQPGGHCGNSQDIES